MVQFNFSDKNALGGFGKLGGKAPQSPMIKFSVDDAKDLFFRYKIEFICGAVALVNVFFLWQFVSAQMEKVKVLSGEIQVLSAKETPVASLKKVIETENALTSAIQRSLPENKFIPQLTLMAKKREVTISAITPPESENMGFFRRSYSQLTGSAGSFKDAMLLINDIERSEYSLKVDSWNITPSDVSQLIKGRGDKTTAKASASVENVKVKFILKISSIEMLGNEKKQRKE